ncbi:MAG: hypothetical protein IPN79_04165 [Saprospiraceae bacterium]|nr:hypothetical protein [Saprospiraceae bacterium]
MAFNFSIITGFVILIILLVSAIESSGSIYMGAEYLEIKYLPFKFWKKDMNIKLNEINKVRIIFHGKSVYATYKFVDISLDNYRSTVTICLGRECTFDDVEFIKTKLEDKLGKEIKID